MGTWHKEYKWQIKYKGFIYNYDTAKELGCMVAESESRMPNPYDPQCTDYDDYQQAIYDFHENMNVNLLSK